MLEKIDEVLQALAENDAPEDIVEKVRDVRNDSRWHPTADYTYELIEIFNKHTGKKWARAALDVVVGKAPKYDPKRESPDYNGYSNNPAVDAFLKSAGVMIDGAPVHDKSE